MRILPFFLAGSLLVAVSSAVLAREAADVPGSPLRALDTSDDQARVYIVQFKAPAAVTEAAAQGLDTRSDETRRYAKRLVTRHNRVLADLGAEDAKIYSYRYALNGFAARLTPAQAQKLKSRKDVRRVWEDRLKYTETDYSPGFLGLTDGNAGLWTRQGLKGDGVVIGVIDSGIAPGHPSFSDKQEARRPRLCRSTWSNSTLLGKWLCRRFKNREDTVVFTPPADWHGQCQAGERFTASDCNGKVIGARYYIDGFLEQYELDPNEIISPRDADGHGTHIASVAAGNPVKASLGGAFVDNIQGMAPRAQLAVYKACWLEPGQVRGSCSTSDLARAIEDAVADGVDIINYSVGSDDDLTDPDDLALLAATDAGVLAVAAAGNEGPTPGSILSPAAAPWVLAVGASSRRGEFFQEALRVNEPASIKKDYAFIEASFTPRLRDTEPLTLDLVLADDGVFGLFDDSVGTPADACEALRNASSITGKIAFIQRGGCAFEVKVRNAQNAGAKAAVVYNTQGEPLLMNGTRGSVDIPAVMIGQADGELIRARLAAGETVEVTLQKGLFLAQPDNGNQMEAFSARGPSVWEPDILKPDVTAPGVNILGAQTPDVANNVQGELFQYLSGTSMAVPHVSGVAALLKEAHPDWTPAMFRSALVTTARQNILKEDGETPADPFDFGGGHIVPNAAVAPGLVFDADTDDYDAFLCGRGTPRDATVDCAALTAAGHSTAAVDLNEPAIAVSRLVSGQVIRRRLTNVGDAGQWSASVNAPTTINVEVSPPVLSLEPGDSADVELRVTAAETTLDAWQFGDVTWVNGSTTVRSPLAVRAVALEAPALVSGSGSSGSLEVPVLVGYTGSYSATLSGIEAAGASQPSELQAGLSGATVTDDPLDNYSFVQPGAGTLPLSVRRIPIVVPPGTRYLRVALFNQFTDGAHDLDLYLYYCPGFGECTEEAVPSGNLGSDETINLVPADGEEFVAPGEYYVDVHGFNTAGGGTATFDLFVWTVGADRGNGTLTAPGAVSAGNPITLQLNWQGLPPGPGLGLITHSDGSQVLDRTVVEIAP